MLKILDLFSGIGGFSLGLERTGGFETVAFCEIDPFCRKVLAKHWPGVPIYEDVKTISKPTGYADIITGGFPCQDLSSAGARRGITGERSGLWGELFRIVGEVRPKFLIFENVTGLLSGENGRWFDTLLHDLASIGFILEWECIPASSIGAPHHRDRIYGVAYPDKNGWLRIFSQANFKVERNMGDNRWINWMGHGEGHWTNWQTEKECGLSGEPIIARKNDGVSGWVDRNSALGNAVVPQIPELIGRAILSAEAASPQEE